MAFSHIRGGGSSTTSVTLGSAPSLGDLVVVAFCNTGSQNIAITCQDSNSNVYTKTTNSPSATTSNEQMSLFYLLSAPANANATITCSGTGIVSNGMWVDEFSYSGTSHFDKDAIATGTGTTVNTPTITPTNANSLLYSGAGEAATITAPTAGATLGVWTGSAGAIVNGNMAEYDLSATSNTAVQYTTTSGAWTAIVAAFYTTISNVHNLASLGAGQ